MSTDEPRTLLGDLVFPEGPRWRDGRLWFSDMHAHEVVAVDLQGRRETIARVPEQPSGLGWLPDGSLLVVSMKDRALLRRVGTELAPYADLSTVCACLCNDMVVDAVGRAYVGNFGFDLYAGEAPRPTSMAVVTPDGRVSEAAGDLMFPNGTVITPDGRTLIVGETFAMRLTAFDVAMDGTLSNRREWAPLPAPPDGICLDAEGCVWVAVPLSPGAFLRVREGGEIVERIDLPDSGGFACMLGGEDGCSLFLLEASHSTPGAIERGNARIRVARVSAPHAGWP